MDVERSVAAVPFDHALLHAVHAMARWQRRTLHSIRADRGVVPGSGSTDQRSASAKSKGARTGVQGTACRIAGAFPPRSIFALHRQLRTAEQDSLQTDYRRCTHSLPTVLLRTIYLKTAH